MGPAVARIAPQVARSTEDFIVRVLSVEVISMCSWTYRNGGEHFINKSALAHDAVGKREMPPPPAFGGLSVLK